MSRTLAARNPVAFAVVASMIVCAFIFSVGVAISGSYYLTEHVLSNQKKEEQFLQVRAAGAQVRAGIPTCKALIRMDDASNGLVFAPPGRVGIFKAEIYSARLSKAVHAVVADTHCLQMIKWVDEGVPYPEIARRLARLH